MKDSDNNNIQCFKISSEWKGKDDKELQKFKVQLSFYYQDSFKKPDEMYLYVTSEKNSFGLTLYQWFDGLIDVSLEHKDVGHQLLPGGNIVKIAEVNEFRNMDATCSDDSFFDCMARQFKMLDTSKINITVGGFDCKFKEKCQPFSLPIPGKMKAPVCSSEADQACFDALLKRIVSDQAKFCKKLCIVKEFKTEVEEMVDRPTQKNTYDVEYRFKAIKSSTHLRTEKLLKNIHSEY